MTEQTKSPAPDSGPVKNDGEPTVEDAMLRERVIDTLKTVFDPEIPVNIYEVGLIYGVEIDPARFVTVTMTLTSPMCPVAGTLPGEVEEKVRSVSGATGARVNLVWEPAWKPEMMSEAAKLTLGFL